MTFELAAVLFSAFFGSVASPVFDVLLSASSESCLRASVGDVCTIPSVSTASCSTVAGKMLLIGKCWLSSRLNGIGKVVAGEVGPIDLSA